MQTLFTSSDAFCPTNSYELSMTNDYANRQAPSSANLVNFYNSGSTLNFAPRTEGTYTFFVLALSSTNKYAFRQVSYEVTDVCDTST